MSCYEMTNNPCLRKNDSQLSWLREPETKFLGGGVWGKLGALGAGLMPTDLGVKLICEVRISSKTV